MDARDTSIEVDILDAFQRRVRCITDRPVRSERARSSSTSSNYGMNATCRPSWGFHAMLDVIADLCGGGPRPEQQYASTGHQYRYPYPDVDDLDVMTCDSSRRTWNSDDTSLNTLHLLERTA